MSYVKPSTLYKREHKADYGREKIQILYQDQYLVVISKPSGLLSVPYPGSKVRTAQSVLEEILRKQGEVNARHKPYVVHRLDRDTSGIMMFALTEQAQKIIMDTWHIMVKERIYHALAENPSVKASKTMNEGHGAKDQKGANAANKLFAKEGLIDLPIAQNAHNVGFVPKADDKDKNGRAFKTVPARTHYKKLIEGPTHTLFELSLDTGKKNQIRAHLAYYGYTLCGDEEHRAKTDPFKRLCLHARTLEFVHPFTNELLKFEEAEDLEWSLLAREGEKNHKTPVWLMEKDNKKAGKENQIKLGPKPLSRKEKAHMNFIESGKKHF